MTALPLLDDVAEAARHCSYCPKLCRFACPVAEATGRESVNPWGIDREITVAAQRGSVDEATASAVYACTGCRACGSACLPGLDLPTHVRAARAAVVDAGLAPAGIELAAGNERAVDGALLAAATAGAGLVVFPGCRSEDGEAIAMLLRAAGVDWDVVREPVCCGGRSVDVGLAEQGERQGAHAAAQLAGAERVVAADPHCARRLRMDLGDERVLTLPALLAELAPSLSLPASGEAVVWHDPCWLGRGMGEYDAVRALVRSATGQDALEPAFSRDRTRCTGGGMGFDAAYPRVAEQLAASRAEELRDAGGDRLPVVTACPTAAAKLAAAGLDAHDLAAWLAARLGATGRPTAGDPAGDPPGDESGDRPGDER